MKYPIAYIYNDCNFMNPCAGADICFSNQKELEKFISQIQLFVKENFNQPCRENYEYRIRVATVHPSHIVHEINLIDWWNKWCYKEYKIKK